MDIIENPRERPPIEIPLNPIINEAKQSIRLEKLSIEFGTGFKISPITMEIPYGRRIGILGNNGTGKTTLLKLITGAIKPTHGSIAFGNSLILGNLMQAHEDLPLQMSVADFLIERGKVKSEQVYHILSKFNFEQEDAKKKISELSPGERTRLILALFALMGANVLVLDEPTNHLDIEALIALEDVLKNYIGTVIVVSHDRYFLKHIHIDQFFVLSDGELQGIPDYDSYISKITKDKKRILKDLIT